jgi:hypothetical protein
MNGHGGLSACTLFVVFWTWNWYLMWLQRLQLTRSLFIMYEEAAKISHHRHRHRHHHH